MAVIAEYITGGDAGENITYLAGEGSAVCQIFTAGFTGEVSTLRVRLYKDADATSSFYVQLVSLTGGEPVPLSTPVAYAASVLSTYLGDTDDLGIDTDGAWISCDISGDAVTLTSGTQYAIVIRYENAGKTIYWKQDTSSPSYAGGKSMLYAYDPGSWGDYGSDVDCMFGVDGAVPFTPPSGKPTTKRLVACAASAFWYEDV